MATLLRVGMGLTGLLPALAALRAGWACFANERLQSWASLLRRTARNRLLAAELHQA